MFANLIAKDFYPLLADYAKILLPSLITYLVTRYTLSRPRKYEIRQKQFELVYLPLYLLCKQLLTPKSYKQNLHLFIKKVDRIIYKNYPYVFPKTLKLFDKLKESALQKNLNTIHLTNFEYQVSSDYEKLKRELGYPTNSFLDFFKRLNQLDKILYVFLLVALSVILYSVIDSFLLFLAGDILKAISALFVSAILALGIYIISYPFRH